MFAKTFARSAVVCLIAAPALVISGHPIDYRTNRHCPIHLTFQPLASAATDGHRSLLEHFRYRCRRHRR